MQTLEVFFDYACPYCLRGHEYLTELLPDFPQIEAEWRPCEAHPRPDRYGLHSDLCARGMFVAREQGADLMEYHRRMYRAALTDRKDIEDVQVVTDAAASLLDADAFRKALDGGAYERELRENNRLAWEVYRFDAVPSFRLGERRLLSVENVGVTKEQLRRFLSNAGV